jgi:hypothetical protein
MMISRSGERRGFRLYMLMVDIPLDRVRLSAVIFPFGVTSFCGDFSPGDVESDDDDVVEEVEDDEVEDAADEDEQVDALSSSATFSLSTRSVLEGSSTSSGLTAAELPFSLSSPRPLFPFRPTFAM